MRSQFFEVSLQKNEDNRNSIKNYCNNKSQESCAISAMQFAYGTSMLHNYFYRHIADDALKALKCKSIRFQ